MEVITIKVCIKMQVFNKHLIIDSSFSVRLKSMREDPQFILRALESVEVINDLINEFNGLNIDKTLVIYNLYSVRDYIARLLKFVENYKGKLIGLTSDDGLSFPFLSRFHKIEKHVKAIDVSSDSPDAMKEVFVADEEVNRDELVLRRCHSSSSLYQSIKTTHYSDKNKAKLVELLV